MIRNRALAEAPGRNARLRWPRVFRNSPPRPEGSGISAVSEDSGQGVAGGGTFSFREISAWMLLAAACLGLRLLLLGANLNNDGYQYLSVANNIAVGNGISTSIPFYETELSHGTIPAPSTHFPPGYSLLIAAISALKVRPETAASAVSFLGFVALAPLFLIFARRLGIHPGAARTALIMLLVDQELLESASSLATELSFTAMTLAALLLIQISQTAKQDSIAAAVAGGVAAAGAYWIRYAGLFMAGTLALLCVLRLLQRRRAQFVRAAVSLFTCLLCIAPIIVRSERLVGSWRGYNTKYMFHPAGIAKQYVVSMYHLSFGWGAARYTAPFAVLCLGCVIILGVAAARPDRHMAAWISIPAIFAATYTAAILYLGITSDIGFGPRMFIPVLPVLLLLGSALCTGRQTAIGRPAAVALAYIAVVAFTASNLIASSGTKVPSPHLNPQAAVFGELKAILDADPRVLVSSDGQAVGYALHRPVVGLVGDDYGNTRWTEQDVHDLMLRYGACHLLLFPGANTHDGQQSSPFLRSLTAGQHPLWLRLQADNGRGILYDLGCGRGAPNNR